MASFNLAHKNTQKHSQRNKTRHAERDTNHMQLRIIFKGDYEVMHIHGIFHIIEEHLWNTPYTFLKHNP
jgi:hypothetical protein